ncbi:3-keto-disaccharide hydrolase [Pontibacter beigongshangensis]|uniref:3-keto-disaccharide hydrolase n=1 Tax=Pontibacter beigongshangensis TaxID=2574733 RepID=UPI00164F3627|nr:DUF1080 domain-containing protein [Pontibacter beigongshangensis]
MFQHYCRISSAWLFAVASLVFAVVAVQADGQRKTVPLTDLSFFRDPGKSWQVAGDVTADLVRANLLTASKGTGVLVNTHSKKKPGQDLFTVNEYGDVDLELEYMMAAGSNSGIYLQGRYELQLMDSWGETNLTAASNGGVYERWDDSRPKGQQGYQGYVARQHAGRAPGLWQHLKISFQAPRFDAAGKKVANARFLRVELNGTMIHENVELTGPTRGAISNEEKPTGPIRLQGDHGSVAFRHIRVSHFTSPRPELTALHYTVYKGRYDEKVAYNNLPPEAAGATGILTSNLDYKSNRFFVRYTGTLSVKEPGDYSFSTRTPGGASSLRINKKEVIQMREWDGKGNITLPKGELPVEILYTKYMDWAAPVLELKVSGPGLREFIISDPEVGLANITDPILVSAEEKPILRSFMDVPGNYRVTHAVSVGSPTHLHYTYDLDHGMLVQLWRGGFIDATPMWHDRGDGSSRPIGSVKHFGKPALTLAKLTNEQAAWVTDTTGSGYRPKGYRLSPDNQPTFMYEAHGASVQDALRIVEKGQGIRRELTLQHAGPGLYVRLAEGSKIEEIGKGLYLIDDKSYYLRVEEAGGAKPVLRNMAGKQELLLPVRQKLVYSILF